MSAERSLARAAKSAPFLSSIERLFCFGAGFRGVTAEEDVADVHLFTHLEAIGVGTVDIARQTLQPGFVGNTLFVNVFEHGVGQNLVTRHRNSAWTCGSLSKPSDKARSAKMRRA